MLRLEVRAIEGFLRAPARGVGAREHPRQVRLKVAHRTGDAPVLRGATRAETYKPRLRASFLVVLFDVVARLLQLAEQQGLLASSNLADMAVVGCGARFALHGIL